MTLEFLQQVVAHSVSGLYILGVPGFVAALVATELQRWLLRIEVAAHHIDPVATADSKMATAEAASPPLSTKTD